MQFAFCFSSLHFSIFFQDIGDDSNDTDYTPGGPVAADDYPAKRVFFSCKFSNHILARKEMMPGVTIYICSLIESGLTFQKSSPP